MFEVFLIKLSMLSPRGGGRACVGHSLIIDITASHCVIVVQRTTLTNRSTLDARRINKSQRVEPERIVMKCP